jgi:hypothetical protein
MVNSKISHAPASARAATSVTMAARTRVEWRAGKMFHAWARRSARRLAKRSRTMWSASSNQRYV